MGSACFFHARAFYYTSNIRKGIAAASSDGFLSNGVETLIFSGVAGRKRDESRTFYVFTFSAGFLVDTYASKGGGDVVFLTRALGYSVFAGAFSGFCLGSYLGSYLGIFVGAVFQGSMIQSSVTRRSTRL